MDVFNMTYVKNTTIHKLKKTAKITLFKMLKVILEENWQYLEEHLYETIESEQFLGDLGIYYIIVGQPWTFTKKFY